MKKLSCMFAIVISLLLVACDPPRFVPRYHPGDVVKIKVDRRAGTVIEVWGCHRERENDTTPGCEYRIRFPTNQAGDNPYTIVRIYDMELE
jgi:hypothetical protein